MKTLIDVINQTNEESERIFKEIEKLEKSQDKNKRILVKKIFSGEFGTENFEIILKVGLFPKFGRNAKKIIKVLKIFKLK